MLKVLREFLNLVVKLKNYKISFIFRQLTSIQIKLGNLFYLKIFNRWIEEKMYDSEIVDPL